MAGDSSIHSNFRPKLPSTKQTWSHCTVSQEELSKALNDDSITAIEADLLMGTVVEGSTTTQMVEENDQVNIELVPIMSHPPDTTSDLSTESFVQQMTSTVGTENNKSVSILRKHCKLDFKQLDAVEPTLAFFQSNDSQRIISGMNPTKESTAIFLNADILPGPGKTIKDILVPSRPFLDVCIHHIRNKLSPELNVFFSLGYAAYPAHPFGYEQRHVDEMIHLIEDYQLLNTASGLILPMNARLLVKNVDPFLSFLKRYPESQILAWTGTGEPPISQRKINKLKRAFDPHTQIGFDCVIVPSYTLGLLYDLAVDLYGYWVYVRDFFQTWIGLTSISSKKKKNKSH